MAISRMSVTTVNPSQPVISLSASALPILIWIRKRLHRRRKYKGRLHIDFIRSAPMSKAPVKSSVTLDPASDNDTAVTDHWIEPLSNGSHVLIRLLHATDRQREFDFIKNLSPQSRHFRFLVTMAEPSEPLLDQLMDLDSRQRMAYVALHREDGVLTEIGVARYAAIEGQVQCESAVVVADQWQGKGLGTRLMKHLINSARLNGFEQMISMDSASNLHMRRLAKALGFIARQDPLDPTQVMYELQLNRDR